MGDRGLLDFIIARMPGISSSERLILAKKFDRDEDLCVLSKQAIEECLGRSLRTKRFDMASVRKQAAKDVDNARTRGIGWVSFFSAAYPPLLREIADPPVLLYFRGRLPEPEIPLAAIVGTRKPTGPALAQAYDFSKSLAESGVPVVSGLALGIDAMAHRGAVEGNASTIAVLGSGLDEIYPATNRMLARRILESGGALLSEYAPGVKPQKWHFPARNRIISGLSRGIIIIEAPRSSGAMITAQFSLEQGRDIWVASSGIASPCGDGTRKLAEEGAPVLSTVDSLLDEWGIVKTEQEKGCAPFNRTELAASLAQSINIKM